MAKTLAKTTQYSKLISDLRRLLEEGKKQAQSAVNRVLVETYWKMGKRICKDGAFEESSIKQIATDLDLERTLVNRVVKFYRTWPNVCPVGHTGHSLSWAHYKELLAIKDQRKREFYLNETFNLNWSRNQLAQKIKDDYYKEVKSEKKADGTLDRKTENMYLYSAIVEKVVDGDTLLLRIDLGFDVWVNQRIRLRAIDCPEASTPEGQKAKSYVEDQLKDCKTAVIQTFKRIDVYGRYVCDVFYLKGEADKELVAEKGNFLNQKLLDEGLAVLL